MSGAEEIAEKTYRLEVQVPAIDRDFAVYFIHEGEGVLIEPGPAAVVPYIQKGMEQLGMRDLSYIIPTHIHLDHGGGIGQMAALFPRAKVVLHPQGMKHAIEPSRLIQSTRASFGNDFEASWGPILPVPESQVKVPLDGETISVDGRSLQIIYAPGHASHHMAIFDLKTGGLFCGEALGMPRPGAEDFPLPFATPGFDLEVSLETMERLRKLKPRLLFYSHGGAGREPEKLISQAVENIRVFGDIILKALKDGKSPEAISRSLRDYTSAVRPNLKMGEVDTAMTVLGYTAYFKKKGLV